MTTATLAEHELPFKAIAAEICSNVVGLILKERFFAFAAAVGLCLNSNKVLAYS